MQSAKQNATIVDSLSALPPLPSTAQQIMDAFGDEFIDADAITEIIVDDPGISARLLGLANSAYYGLAEPVDCLVDAVGRVIGVETVRSVVLAIAMQKALDQSRCSAFDAERFWKESLMAAQCCKRIALRDQSLPEQGKRLAYVTGLCHNIGLMALAFLEPEATHAVLVEHDERHMRFDSALERAVGISHREATMVLAERWSLPDVLVDAYRCRFDASALADSRLGLILVSATTAIGNLDIEEPHKLDLTGVSKRLGMAVEDLQSMALPGERQLEQIETLASSMC
ncbi:MAG: HDOD domain-containing protein [Pseudomonadota bacterium]